jgi:hypothetical protein
MGKLFFIGGNRNCSYIKAFMYQFLVMQQKAGQQQAKMKIG